MRLYPLPSFNSGLRGLCCSVTSYRRSSLLPTGWSHMPMAVRPFMWRSPHAHSRTPCAPSPPLPAHMCRARLPAWRDSTLCFQPHSLCKATRYVILRAVCCTICVACVTLPSELGYTAVPSDGSVLCSSAVSWAQCVRIIPCGMDAHVRAAFCARVTCICGYLFACRLHSQLLRACQNCDSQ